MPSIFDDTMLPASHCTECGAIDFEHYEREARRLRAESMGRWRDAAPRLLIRGWRGLAGCVRRAMLRNEMRTLDDAARKDLGIGISDLDAIVDGGFAEDPSRRPRGKSVARPVCWLNGALVPLERAHVSVFDHGLLYGDGVFEGVRFYRRRAFRLEAHLERLYRSALALRLAIPYDRATLAAGVEATIAAFHADDGYLRLVATRGEGRLGLDPSSCGRANVFVIADDLALVSEAVRERGARLIIAATRRLPADGLDPRIKSLNYLNHILARMEAGNAGADEAILLNAQGRVAEGTADNVFIVREGRLLTPPAIDGALEGITRGVVLELAAREDIPAREASLAPYDLYTADECFLTGTGAELIPVREVDGRPLRFSPGPVYRRLQEAFDVLTRRQDSCVQT